jgi:hypothetical protein
MSQALPKLPAFTRFVLGILALVGAFYTFRLVDERAFPDSWKDVGILLCAAAAFPHVPPGRS